MQITVTVPDELAAEAQARGLTVDHYVEKIVQECPIEQPRQRSVAEAIDSIRGVAQRK